MTPLPPVPVLNIRVLGGLWGGDKYEKKIHGKNPVKSENLEKFK
jgi:hypothetical protein